MVRSAADHPDVEPIRNASFLGPVRANFMRARLMRFGCGARMKVAGACGQARENQVDRNGFSAEPAAQPGFRIFAAGSSPRAPVRDTSVPRELVNARRDVVYAGDASGFPFSTT